MADEQASEVSKLIEEAERCVQDVCAKHFGKANTPIYSHHFYLMGIAKRALSQGKAFRWAVVERNSLVAAALVRMQLDTVLRLYALWWVADPEAFAQEVWDGRAIRKLKAADGQLLSDKYLCDRLKEHNDWIPSVYDETSGYVHFSHRHIQSALTLLDDETGAVRMHIGPSDYQVGASYYDELERAFLHITSMIPLAVDDWLQGFREAAH